jgi:hypothetical protein
MRKITKNSLLLLSLMALTFTACKKDPVDNNCDIVPTYNSAVKVIIDNNCALSGCHDGGGFAPGNYTSFQGLSGVTSNGKFRNRVLVVKDMPLGFELSASEFETLRCWADNGFPLQ